MSPQKQELPAGVFLTEKQKRLHEVTGHLGPWTGAELVAAGLVVEMSPDAPQPDPPAKVRKAHQAEDEARLAFDEADRAWREAFSAARAARVATGPTLVSFSDLNPFRRADQKTIDKAEDLRIAAERAWEAREDAARALVRAKTAYRAAWRDWQRSLKPKEKN